MSLETRIILIIVSVIVLLFILRKVRQAKLNIIDSIFWIVVAGIMILFSVFPQIAYFLTDLLGISVPINFILILIIAIIMLKVFLNTLTISRLQESIKVLSQRIAYDEFEEKEKKDDVEKSEKYKKEV